MALSQDEKGRHEAMHRGRFLAFGIRTASHRLTFPACNLTTQVLAPATKIERHRYETEILYMESTVPSLLRLITNRG